MSEAVSGLTARQRQVIRMRFLDGLEYPEIAQRLGCGAGAVRVAQMGALRAQRKSLDGVAAQASEVAVPCESLAARRVAARRLRLGPIGIGSRVSQPLTDRMHAAGHEQVIFHQDEASGLRAIVAIHSSLLGPALGGTRWYPYADEEAALDDVLRLSAAMTSKAAVAGVPLGGGKAAVIGDPSAKTEAQLRAYAAFIESLGGRYITTTDVGTTTAEIDFLADHTRYVVGTSAAKGGSGDTAVLTGQTVTNGLRAALQFAYGTQSLAGRHVVVVGAGKVGARVARYAAQQGVRVSLADVREQAVQALAQELGATVVDAETAYELECDVLSPNALGGVLTADSIERLRCRIVCGAANNQLARDPDDADQMRRRGIVYAPDYVVNSGGVIGVTVELEGYDAARTAALVDAVYETTLGLLQSSEREGISTAHAAQRLAQQRLAAARSN